MSAGTEASAVTWMPTLLSSMKTVTEVFNEASVALEDSWKPIIARVAPEEVGQFREFCRGRSLRVIDEYQRQLWDLAVARLPAASDAERREFADARLDAAGREESAGNWIILPWEGKVVHLLEEDEYFEVITNRNHDKITRPEQQLLRDKKVGVMGLSLGAEAAASVAQEHLCGHIALADYDRLDLSNLNRINAGFDDLGIPKTTLAARRIVKIDPYIRVTVFPTGVTAENVDRFLDGLDLLLEECDDITMKFDIRVKVRSKGIDVLFAGDERGFLSVEPYGRESGLPPFHGRIVEPQPPREAFATKSDFFVELSEWLGGWQQISDRTRQSLEQVGTTLCGYPQLASEARFAAAQVGHVARRLLLGERVRPFLGYVDLEEIVPGNPRPETGNE